MAGEADFEIGQRVSIDGQMCEFMRLVAPREPSTDARRDLQFEEVETGYRFSLSHTKFDKLVLDYKIQVINELDRPGDEIPEEFSDDNELRDLRQWLMRAFDEHPVPKTDKALTEFIKITLPKLPVKSDWTPSGATLRTWLRTRGEPGDRRRKHMGRRREHGRRNLSSHLIAQEVFAKKVAAYWQRNGVSSVDVWAAVAAEINSLNADRKARWLDEVPIPDPSTIWRWIQRQSVFENVKRRVGGRKAKRLFKAARTYKKPTRILELVLIDHTQLDCHTQDERYPNVVERPWLTLAIDSYSRCIVGFVVTFTAPSIETVMACLRQVVRPKTEYLAQFPEVTRSWPIFGMPSTVLSDRGMEFMGTSYIDALADVGISLELAPAKTPEFKGRCERFFDTLKKRLLDKLPGAVPFKSDKMRELEINPVAEAKITKIELEELILETILDYHHDYHSGLRGVPQNEWNKQAHSIRYAPNLWELDIALAKTGPERHLTSNGVDFVGLRYCSSAVADLLNDMWPVAPRRGAREASVPVKFKYHPEDISRIFVWNFVRRSYVELPCLDAEFTRGLSEFGYEQIKRTSEEDGLAFSSQEARCAARARTTEKALSKLRTKRMGDRQLWRKVALHTEVQSTAIGRTVEQGALPEEMGGIPVSSVGNRSQGEMPERARTRKTASRKPKKHIPPAGHRPTAAVDDYFADIDRDAVLSKAELGIGGGE